MVQEALEVAQQGRTSITIAHRLSTIMESDRSAFGDNEVEGGDGDGGKDYWEILYFCLSIFSKSSSGYLSWREVEWQSVEAIQSFCHSKEFITTCGTEAPPGDMEWVDNKNFIFQNKAALVKKICCFN